MLFVFLPEYLFVSLSVCLSIYLLSDSYKKFCSYVALCMNFFLLLFFFHFSISTFLSTRLSSCCCCCFGLFEVFSSVLFLWIVIVFICCTKILCSIHDNKIGSLVWGSSTFLDLCLTASLTYFYTFLHTTRTITQPQWLL